MEATLWCSFSNRQSVMAMGWWWWWWWWCSIWIEGDV